MAACCVFYQQYMETNTQLYYAIFKTCAGWIAATASARGCVWICFPQNDENEARQALGEQIFRASHSPERFKVLSQELGAYYLGQNPLFSVEIDISSATPFEQAVWLATRKIRHGETRSYSWVAAEIGKPQAARAVGQALGRNPLPVLIPCHRVLARDGGLGGFGGGLKMKRYLLDLEAQSRASLHL
jgi:methylated-DNA-[protein]-cysteine S-methyltransferase